MCSLVKSPGEGQVDVPSDIMVGFIGAGRMAHAMVKGFISSGAVKASNIIASCPHPDSSDVKDLGVNVTSDNKEVIRRCSVVVVAVKPNVVPLILKEVAPVVTKDNVFISIAAGIPLKTIEQYLPPGTRVLRVSLNTPASVHVGAAVVAKGTAASDTDSGLIVRLMESVGLCEEREEKLLDAIGAVSGCGTAYAFVMIQAMADGGVKMGLPRDLATRFAAQTLMGAGKMVLETGKHPEQLKDEVCSPGGSTIAAMHRLESAGFRGALMDAVEAATLRNHELANQ